MKKGQIAHLDRDPSNNALDNLAFLCLPHHDEYDSTTSQSKNLTIHEVKRYRAMLYRSVESFMKGQSDGIGSDTQFAGSDFELEKCKK